MDIVVNDTNIFIDLCKLNLLDEVFQLPLGMHTVDFVIRELREEQKEMVCAFSESGQLVVHSFTSNEISEIIELKDEAGGNVSITDCSAWYYAKVNKYTLLTGDGQLRKKASASDVIVKGILYLFDLLVSEGILSRENAAIKLKELIGINHRLPRKEMDARIDRWESM